MRKQVNNYWKKMTVPSMSQGGDSWERQIDEVWAQRGDNISRVCQIRFFQSNTFGKMTHYIMKKVDERKGPLGFFNSEEPTYAEKIAILEQFKKGNNYAIEVFPKTSQLVDEANLYHMWEFRETPLPFSLEPVFNFPSIEEREGNIEYAMHVEKTSYGRVGYLYLKNANGMPLKWKEKQKIKDEIIGEDLTAVEIISKEMPQENTCLICLPMNYKLDFGIHSTR